MRPSDPGPLARASNAFGFELWQRVRAGGGNLAISPASISSALAMTWGGARGDTASEMKQTLRIDVDAEVAMTGWGQLTTALQSKPKLTLRIANRLFGEKSYRFEDAYLAKTKAAYGAALEPIDFAKSPEPSRAHINAWVEQQTENRIKNLLPPRSIDADTRLVLVNAIYFLANWQAQFEKRQTSQQHFKLAPGKNKPAMLMTRRGSYRIVRADDMAMLELPYVDGNTAMLVVLPDQIDGLDQIETRLNDERLSAWTSSLVGEELLVTLPRFKIDLPSAMDLAHPLKSSGMNAAFDLARADFTGIANPPSAADRLVIGAVFHKAFVKVDEQGTEAAAATAISIPRGGRPRPTPEFRADHPFLFLIVDKTSGLVLFIGRVVDPIDPA
jgi:serpin B